MNKMQLKLETNQVENVDLGATYSLLSAVKAVGDYMQANNQYDRPVSFTLGDHKYTLPLCLEQVREARLTKEDLVKLYNLRTVDYALPQDWLDERSTRLAHAMRVSREDAYDFIRSTTVWKYETGDWFGKPFSLVRDHSDITEQVLSLR